MGNCSIGIVGAGKLAQSLLLNPVNGYSYTWVIARSEKRKAAIDGVIDSYPGQKPAIYDSIDKAELPELIFLAVSDNAVKVAAETVAEKYHDSLSGKHIVHFSGINPKNILQACGGCGAFVHKAHPYQTFYYPEKGLFEGIYWGVDLSAESGPVTGFIGALNGWIIDMTGKSPEEHVKYHISAVAASNFLNTLLANSRNLLDEIRLDSRIVIPIINQTLKNAFRGEEFPLTGPISRGDIDTVKKHIEALGDDKVSVRFYAMMSYITAELCREKGIPGEEFYPEIESLLKQYF